MRVLNLTNIDDAEKIVRLCAEDIDTSDLTVYVMLPETEVDKNFNGVFVPDNPPVIKIFLHDAILSHNRYKFGTTNVKQHIASVFLHELYHYAAWKKGIPYVKKRQEPLADIYAFHTLKSIGFNIQMPQKLSENLRADTSLDYDTIVEEATDIETHDITATITSNIPLPGYIDRASISASLREHLKRNPQGGIENIRTSYIRRFHCGHYSHSSTGNDIGMDCSNKLPRNKRIPNWYENYHIVCIKCVVSQGCKGCGRPGDRICLTLTDGQWLCVDCLNEQQKG
ncbi:MAG: hypothetical protein DRO96_01570 [Candidatus Aenigmatarchaeota archaeon]|nr:MAG: hypothetical protein DRO96_01570 [Candidatus Aenigmarchaeota archaeon]